MIIKIMPGDLFDEALENCARSRNWQNGSSRIEAVSVEKAPGWSWRAAAGGADAGCLCGPQQSALRRALPRAPEVQGF